MTVFGSAPGARDPLGGDAVRGDGLAGDVVRSLEDRCRRFDRGPCSGEIVALTDGRIPNHVDDCLKLWTGHLDTSLFVRSTVAASSRKRNVCLGHKRPYNAAMFVMPSVSRISSRLSWCRSANAQSRPKQPEAIMSPCGTAKYGASREPRSLPRCGPVTRDRRHSASSHGHPRSRRRGPSCRTPLRAAASPSARRSVKSSICSGRHLAGVVLVQRDDLGAAQVEAERVHVAEVQHHLLFSLADGRVLQRAERRRRTGVEEHRSAPRLRARARASGRASGSPGARPAGRRRRAGRCARSTTRAQVIEAEEPVGVARRRCAVVEAAERDAVEVARDVERRAAPSGSRRGRGRAT